MKLFNRTSGSESERSALEAHLKDLCARIQNEARKAGLAVAANLRMGFFAPLSVSLQSILARIDFLMEKLLRGKMRADEATSTPK